MKQVLAFPVTLPTLLFLLALSACQTPTKVSETDASLEARVFSKIEHGKKVPFKRAVIVDVRSRFAHEMSRVPRSFYAFWKDWDLRPYRGDLLDKKRRELQRLLAIKGIEPFTQVVILGEGLSGRGEEFLLASTLLSLGIEKISFMSEDQAKKAMVARNLPKLQNAPSWERPLKFNFNCQSHAGFDPLRMTTDELQDSATLVVSSKAKGRGVLSPQNIFTKSLKLKRQKWPKTLKPKIYSPGSLFSFGVALALKDQGRTPCVL